MSILRDIERSIGEGMKYLCAPRYWPGGIGNIEALIAEAKVADSQKRNIRLLPICQKTDQARRLLRVEIGYDAQTEIWLDPDCPWKYDGFDFQGPRRLLGVDTYVVDRLPAPGWRVINPMEAK